MAKKGTKKRVAEAEESKAEVTPEPEVLKCKACGSELKKMLFDSRAEKPLYVYVCDKRDCHLYRQPQKKEGVLPEGVNIAIV